MPNPQPANAPPPARHSDVRTDSVAVPASDSSLSGAPRRVADLAAASLSKNTRRAYQGALQRLQDYLDKHDATLEDGRLASYLASLFHRGRSPSSASMVVAARPLSGQDHGCAFTCGAGHGSGLGRVPARGTQEGPGSGRRDQLGDGRHHCRPHYGRRAGVSCRFPRRCPDLDHV